MKVALHPWMIVLLFLFQSSNGSGLIRQSCREASKVDPNFSYEFCVACLEAITKRQPTSSAELVNMSIQLSKSNATKIVSNISKLLKDQKFSQYAKACLQDCYDLYSNALSELEDALGALKYKDFNTANIKVSAAMDASVTCEDQFKDQKNETSPLTKYNNIYTQLNAMSLAFIEMCRHHY